MTLLVVKNLRLCCNGTLILHDVSLTVGEGEIVGLLGPNGAGKTTTILAALGLFEPVAGSIRTLGHDPQIHGAALRRQIGVLPDPNGFYDWMTAPSYLAFFAGLYGCTLDDASITHRLEAVGLTPAAGQSIGTFSRGMRQRLGLARALIADPKLLVLDEPTSGLDPRGRRDIHDLLSSLAKSGVGILLCTHLLDDVERLCARACFIVGGRTVAEGRIADLLRAGAGQARFRLELSGPVPVTAKLPVNARIIVEDYATVTVDVDPAVHPDIAWRELLDLGWPITTIAHESGGLEQVYLDVVTTSIAPETMAISPIGRAV